jgi:hypothetical protein
MTQHGRQDMAIPPPDWYNAKKREAVIILTIKYSRYRK